MITHDEALQITRRIQKMANGLYVPDEIKELAILLEEFLSQPGISSSHDTKSNTELRKIHMQAMVETFEMGAHDILLIARSQGGKQYVLSEMNDEAVKKAYDEARELFYEGNLPSYLHHLLVQEEHQNYLTPQP